MLNNWYVIQVRTGKETLIVETCSRMISSEILKECFIPRYIRMKKIRGTWKRENDILFKGYVFMITDRIEDLFQELKKIPDLTKVLNNDGNEIYPLREEEVLFLMRFGKEDRIVEMSFGYIEGDTIRITNGPLMGQEGIIRKIDRHKRIAYIEVTMFDQVTQAKVGLEIISKK